MFLWFISLNIIFSRSMLLQMAVFQFLWLSNIQMWVCVYIYTQWNIRICVYLVHTLCVYTYIFLSQLSVDEHLSCFHVLVIVNNAAMGIGGHVSFWISVFVLFDNILRSGIDGVVLISSFLRNLHTILHSDFTTLHFYQHCTKVAFSPYPL